MFSKLNKFKNISYSQSGEDLIVKYIFDSIGIKTPSFIDVGAHHPYYLSNTALFYENGCRGINIEPDPKLFINFNKDRKLDINLNIGISDKKGELDFYIISSPTLNTFSKVVAENYVHEGSYVINKIQKIKVETIRNLINKYSRGKFPEFLSLDAEGVDEIIIKSIEFNNNYPIVICIETLSFSTTGRGIKNISLINYITSEGYLVYADTNINTIFVRRDVWEK
jgi:FkbM family methyltransferase